MKIFEIVAGVLFACFLTFIGSLLYVQFVSGIDFFNNINLLIETGFGGKIIAIGSLLNIPLVYILLNKQKFEIGKGVILGLILLVIVSQLI